MSDVNTITLPAYDRNEKHYVEIVDHEGDELLTLSRTELVAVLEQGTKLVEGDKGDF